MKMKMHIWVLEVCKCVTRGPIRIASALTCTDGKLTTAMWQLFAPPLKRPSLLILWPFPLHIFSPLPSSPPPTATLRLGAQASWTWWAPCNTRWTHSDMTTFVAQVGSSVLGRKWGRSCPYFCIKVEGGGLGMELACCLLPLRPSRIRRQHRSLRGRQSPPRGDGARGRRVGEHDRRWRGCGMAATGSCERIEEWDGWIGQIDG